MENQIKSALLDFLYILGMNEEPMGMFFTDTKLDKGYFPNPMDLTTRENEEKNEI